MNLMEGWERKKVSETGVPYYVNQELELTQWDHPHFVKLVKDLSSSQCIRYTAYRTAAKLRRVQGVLGFDGVTLATVVGVLERHGLRPGEGNEVLKMNKIESLISDMFYVTKHQGGGPIILDLATELTVNLLLDIYDKKKTGSIGVLSCQVLLVTLSNGKLQEKFKYLFRQMANHNNCLSKRSLALLLYSLCRIPEWLGEGQAFGKDLVAAATESCMLKYPGPFGVAEEVFIEWMLQEPQTLVWWSTLYRMHVSETVAHSARCGLCKRSPIRGLRYQCLMCWRLDICQNCFFSGIASRQHSSRHPLQEYCRQTTTREKTRDFLQTLKNRLLGRVTAEHNQNRYLPIQPSEELKQELCSVLENIDETIPPPPSPSDSHLELASRTLIPDDNQVELNSIILHIEEKNRCLANELERLENGNRNPDTRQKEVLQDCNHQLEVQLGRLKFLLQHYTAKNPEKGTVKAKREGLTRQMESTPSLAQPLKPLRLPYISPITDTEENKDPSLKEESGIQDISIMEGSYDSISKVSFGDLDQATSCDFSEEADCKALSEVLSSEEKDKGAFVDPELDQLLKQLENLVPSLGGKQSVKELTKQLEDLVEKSHL